MFALTALALGLRVYRLAHDPLWFDEAYTALTARQPIGEIFRLLHTETSGPLYYTLLHGWSAVVGDGDFRLRLFSAWTGAAIVPALYAVGAGLFGSTAGLIAAALGAVAPLHIHYSQELRMYGLVPLVALGVLYGLARVVRDADVPSSVLLAVSLAAGLYLHPYFFFLLPLGVVALLVPTRRTVLPSMGLAFALATLAYLPWIGTLVGQAGPTHATDWIADWWKTRSLWLAVPWSLEVLGPGAVYPAGWFKLGSSALAGAVSLVVALTVLVVAGITAARTRVVGERVALLLTIAAVLVPLIAALIVSVLRPPIYVVSRYDMIALAPYCLLVGAVLARVPPILAGILAALWIGVASATLVPHFTTDRPVLTPANFGSALAAMLRTRAAPGDLVIFAASTRPVTEYYLGDAAARLRLVSYPLGTDDHLGWIDIRIARDDAFAAEEARRFATWITNTAPIPSQIWLVEPAVRGNEPLLAALQRLGYALDAARSDAHIFAFRR
jgi:mannosyltransferase